MKSIDDSDRGQPIPRLTYTADLILPLRTLGEIANPANECSNRIALARISMSCDILADALPFLLIAEKQNLQYPDLNSTQNEGGGLGEIWFEKLHDSCQQLKTIRSCEGVFANQAQLSRAEATLREIAKTALQLNRELKLKILACRDSARENNREELDGESCQDENGKDVSGEDSVYRTLAQFAECLADYERKITLLHPDFQPTSILDLLTYWDCPEIVVKSTQNSSESLGATTADCITAINLVVETLRTALTSLSALPVMKLKDATKMLSSGPDSNAWEYLDNLLLAPVPVVLTAKENRIVGFELRIPDQSLRYREQELIELENKLEGLKPVLNHLGADLSFERKIGFGEEGYLISCDLTLPQTLPQTLPHTLSKNDGKDVAIEFEAAEILRRSGERFEEPRDDGLQDRIVNLIIGSDSDTTRPGGYRLWVDTLAFGLRDKDNRARLVNALPGLVKSSEALGFKYVAAIPYLLGLDGTDADYDIHDLYKFGYYEFLMWRDGRARPSELRPRGQIVRQELDNSCSHLKRLVRLREGNLIDEFELPGQVDHARVALPFSFVAQEGSLELLIDLGKIAEISSLDLWSIQISDAECKQALEDAIYFLQQAGASLPPYGERQIRYEVIQAKQGREVPHLQLLVEDKDGALASCFTWKLGAVQCSRIDFPYRDLNVLNLQLNHALSNLLLSGRQHLTVENLKSKLSPYGFDLSNMLLRKICWIQSSLNAPLSIQEVARTMRKWLTTEELPGVERTEKGRLKL